MEKHRCASCRGGELPGCDVPGCVGGVVTIPEGAVVIRVNDAGLGVSRETKDICPDCGDPFCDGPGNCPPKRGLRPIGEGGLHVSY